MRLRKKGAFAIMNYTRVELGRYIRQQRKYFKLSQDQVAERARVSRQCIGRIEKGERVYPYILNSVLNVLCINPKSVIVIE